MHTSKAAASLRSPTYSTTQSFGKHLPKPQHDTNNRLATEQPNHNNWKVDNDSSSEFRWTDARKVSYTPFTGQNNLSQAATLRSNLFSLFG